MFEPGGATAAFASTPAASLSASPEKKQCPPFADRQARSQPTRHASMTVSDSPAPPCSKNGVSAHSCANAERPRSEEHTSELQSLMRISYAVFCFKKKIKPNN